MPSSQFQVARRLKHSAFLILIFSLWASTAQSAARDFELPGGTITFHLAHNSFPDPTSARMFTQAAIRTWTTYGNADIDIILDPDEAASVVKAEGGEKTIVYDPDDPGCGETTNGFIDPYSPGDCDMVICKWDLNRNSNRYALKVITHEMGHCIGFGHSTESDALMHGVPYGYSSVEWTFLAEDDLDNLLTGTYAYPSRQNELQTMYSSAGTSWTLLSSSVGIVSTASFRKPDVAPAPGAASNRYAIAYTEDYDLHVIVSDGNSTVDRDVDTSGNTYSGAGIAWGPNEMVVLYRARHDSLLYSRRSTNSGATWSGFTNVYGTEVGASVDVAYSPDQGRFYAVAEVSATGIVKVFTSTDGTSWTTLTVTGSDIVTAGGVSISCPDNALSVCVVVTNNAADLNTRISRFTASGSSSITWLTGTVSDGIYSAGEAEVAIEDGDSDYGVYGYLGYWSVNAWRPWLGTILNSTGTVRRDTAGDAAGGPVAFTWGSYYGEYFRVMAFP